ncbi:hypothetical protein AQUCO_01300394v1 [Aquilegia coerulea]|uniref:non-specific serine/threonine protein kinase n=1 Tax=Aquilegia coerulea TaxID=218851 RepID=A0A2G5E1Z7_AQUCA|nr:hypothetical protein AQUCO_01300394v1 [Aquilegia coerulea]
MAVGDESNSSMYRAILNRFRDLEMSHAKLTEHLEMLVSEKEIDEQQRGRSKERRSNNNNNNCNRVEVSCPRFPGVHKVTSPYNKVLQSIGHAVHVCRAFDGKIIYWNRAAETLYGWKEYEALGQRATDLITDEQYHSSIEKIMESLITGHSWSGQFPFKKRSGEIFPALVTKSPLYEDGELVGVITVSSDAAVFNIINSENLKAYQDRSLGHVQPKEWKLNMKKIPWNPKPQISSVSQISSSVSNLASKVFSLRNGDDDNCSACTSVRERGDTMLDSLDAEPEKVETSAAKVLEKLNIGGISSGVHENCNIVPQSGPTDIPIRNHRKGQGIHDVFNKEFSPKNEYPITSWLECHEHPASSAESTSSHENSSNKGDKESDPMVECDIRWEDLHLQEDIGSGSFAVVYRGLWNGSDVAVKVYSENDYRESTLSDYKKEISIMKKLRHPNVLLFMGAVYSPEQLAIVTEFLPRGSLFKTLHRNSQALDIRRRLRMSLDVARGMNYLHHRNPPIIHRDLKSSNLLVDRNWTVKVGDFGLSKWKNATYLTAKSGRGTPQWMAPEVLRNEPSNEKSDVYSFGVILWELFTQLIPWSELNPLQVVGVVGFMGRRLDLPESLDPRMSSMINDCWRSDPRCRPSFQDLIQRMTDLIKTFPPLPARTNSEP